MKTIKTLRDTFAKIDVMFDLITNKVVGYSLMDVEKLTELVVNRELFSEEDIKDVAYTSDIDCERWNLNPSSMMKMTVITEDGIQSMYSIYSSDKIRSFSSWIDNFVEPSSAIIKAKLTNSFTNVALTASKFISMKSSIEDKLYNVDDVDLEVYTLNLLKNIGSIHTVNEMNPPMFFDSQIGVLSLAYDRLLINNKKIINCNNPSIEFQNTNKSLV